MFLLKSFTKVATNRLSTIAQKIIRPTQTAFLLGRNIMGFFFIFSPNLKQILNLTRI
jgi:hypothetical protein